MVRSSKKGNFHHVWQNSWFQRHRQWRARFPYCVGQYRQWCRVLPVLLACRRAVVSRAVVVLVVRGVRGVVVEMVEGVSWRRRGLVQRQTPRRRRKRRRRKRLLVLVLVVLLLLQPVVVVCRASTFDHLVLHVWCPGESRPSFCLSFSSFSFAGAMVLVVSPFFVSSCPSWYGGNVNRRERKVDF